MNAIACCNFPTTLLILDDDQDFLKSIKYALSDKYKCICTDNGALAHDILTKNKGWTKRLMEKGISRIYPEDDTSVFSISMDVLLLKNQIYNPDRFNHIAIAIIDYDMPGQNGLEFIKSLGDSTIKFIMLTGKAEQETVIKAFNDRKIHRYVSKGDHYLQFILQYINELQTEFFFDFSKFILDSITESETHIFENESFIKLFNTVQIEHEAVEYYLLDQSGSFLLLDDQAKNQVWLIVKSAEDMQYLYELAKDDPETPAYVVKQIKDCKCITHFNTKKESAAPAKYWHLLDAQPLDENKKYYYAIVKNDEHFQMDLARIKSYRAFLKQR